MVGILEVESVGLRESSPKTTRGTRPGVGESAGKTTPAATQVAD
jgi:hypothetical protein